MWLLAILVNMIILGFPVDCLAFFDAKIQPSTFLVGGTIAVTVVGGSTALILNIVKCVKNHIGRIESFKIFQSKGMCAEKTNRLKDEIVANRSASSAMGEAINVRLDDIKDLILKNGKK